MYFTVFILQNITNSSEVTWGPLSDTSCCGRPYAANNLCRAAVVCVLVVNDFRPLGMCINDNEEHLSHQRSQHECSAMAWQARAMGVKGILLLPLLFLPLLLLLPFYFHPHHQYLLSLDLCNVCNGAGAGAFLQFDMSHDFARMVVSSLWWVTKINFLPYGYGWSFWMPNTNDSASFSSWEYT